MGFELYKPMRGCAHKSPMLFVRKDGVVLFNNSARTILFTNEIKYIRLYYDRKTRQIGIERLSSHDKDARPVLRAKDGTAFKSGLSLCSFFHHFGLDPEKETGRYLIVSEQDRALSIIQLGKMP